jgi:phytoene dehydrogenase-like protein
VTEEIVPGFKFSVFSYVVSLLRPEIIRDLELPRHGLHVLPLESTFTPLPDGDYLATWADQDLTRREIARHSQQDAEVYEEYSRQMASVAMAVKPLLSMVPPDPTGWSLRDWRALVDLNRHVRSLDEETFRWLYRLMTMSSADFLDMWFECDPLKATKSASGIIGTFMGPRTPGSAYVLLHHYMG